MINKVILVHLVAQCLAHGETSSTWWDLNKGGGYYNFPNLSGAMPQHIMQLYHPTVPETILISYKTVSFAWITFFHFPLSEGFTFTLKYFSFPPGNHKQITHTQNSGSGGPFCTPSTLMPNSITVLSTLYGNCLLFYVPVKMWIPQEKEWLYISASTEPSSVPGT